MTNKNKPHSTSAGRLCMSLLFPQNHLESKGDVFVSLPAGFGKSVVFQALSVVYSHVEPSREKNIVIVVSHRCIASNNR